MMECSVCGDEAEKMDSSEGTVVYYCSACSPPWASRIRLKERG